MILSKAALFIFSITLIFLTGCSTGSDPGDSSKIPVVMITGVEVKPLDQEGNNHFYTDTLRNSFRFSVYTDYDIIGYEEVAAEPNALQSDILPGIIANPTQSKYASVYFNKPIAYRGRTIECGLNLYEDDEIMDSFDGSSMDLLFSPYISPFVIGQIVFKKEAFQAENGEHQIIFQWGNEDGEIFRDTVHVFLDLY